AAETKLLITPRQLDGADATTQEVFARLNTLDLPLAGYSPGAAYIPAARNEIRQILAKQSLAAPFILEVHEFALDREGAGAPVQVESQAQPVPVDVNGREKGFACVRLRSYAVEPFRHGAGGKRDSKLEVSDNVGDFQEAQRCSGHATRERAPGAEPFARAGIFALLLEESRFVMQASSEEASVRR